MKTVLILIALALAGCSRAPMQEAEIICAKQGHSAGSPGYDACFNSVFPALHTGRELRRAAVIASP